jgi:hypothetical protein
MRPIARYALLAGAVILTAGATYTREVSSASADTNMGSWKWPAAAAEPALRASIVNGHYTAEELANIHIVLEFLSTQKRGSNPGWWTADSKSHGGGFRLLETLYGGHDWGETAIVDRSSNVDDIIAKGDRVWVTWIIRGHHTNPILGFPPSGELIQVRDTALIRLRDQKISEIEFRGDELALYTQAGGKLKFPEPVAGYN